MGGKRIREVNNIYKESDITGEKRIKERNQIGSDSSGKAVKYITKR